MKKIILDDQEKDLLESYDRGEWITAKNRVSEIKKLKKYASDTLRKSKRINIRMSAKDLEAIQIKAVEEGMPYQTLISSILQQVRIWSIAREKKGLTTYCTGHQMAPKVIPGMVFVTIV